MESWKRTILKTGVDRLMELIGESDELTIGEASRSLGIDQSTIESWVNALAEDNMITTTYDSQGALLIKSTSKNKKIKKDKIDRLKKDLDTTIGKVDDDLSNEENKLGSSKKNIRSFERILDKDINDIDSFRKNLSIYEKKKEELSKALKKIREEERDLEKESKKIDGEESKLVKEADHADKTIETKVLEVNKAKSKINEIEKSKDQLKQDLEVLKRISKAIKKAHPEQIARKIDDIERRTQKVKASNSIVKQKFENMSGFMKKLFR